MTRAAAPTADSGAFTWPTGSDWTGPLIGQRRSAYFTELEQFVDRRRRATSVYPDRDQVFRALELTPLSEVQFVILGQDPYHGDGQAHGLCFSVPNGIKHPPSLRNILRELADDTGIAGTAGCGDLTGWARRGGLLLNAVLTVDARQAHSHRGRGWERFTDQIISLVSARRQNVAFMLWGNPARQKRQLIDERRHLIIEAPHPSPLSAHRGFFGSRPFSQVNSYRRQQRLPAIDWSLDQ